MKSALKNSSLIFATSCGKKKRFCSKNNTVGNYFIKGQKRNYVRH